MWDAFFEADGGRLMSDQEALIAFQLGERLDQETTRRLWASGYLEVTNLHSTPKGTGDLKGKWITPKGWRLLEKSQPARCSEQLPW
jgi:hypothetical protein